MKTLLAALIAGAFAFAHDPTLAQVKKPEPTKEEVEKAEAKKAEPKQEKAEKADAKKDEGKKKVKKGGC